MGNLTNGFEKYTERKNMTTMEKVMMYEDNYMKLLKKYKDDIDHINSMLENVRNERTQFYNEQLPQIREKLEEDDVSPQNRERWLSILQENMEKSFQISEDLINHYVTKNLDEFKKEAQQIIENGD